MPKLNTKDRELAAFLIYKNQVLEKQTETKDGETIYSLKGRKVNKTVAAWEDMNDYVSAGRYMEIWRRLA